MAEVREKLRRELEQVRAWVEEERRRGRGQTPTNTDKHRLATPGKSSVPVSVKVRERPCAPVPGSAQLVANAALSLLNLSRYLLDRQIAAQKKAFLEEGGFTERLYRVRMQARNRPPAKPR